MIWIVRIERCVFVTSFTLFFSAIFNTAYFV